MSIQSLKGIRVTDLSSVAAGPLCGSYLARMGAEVIFVETRARPDFNRRLIYADGIPGEERGGIFHLLNIDKKSCTINLGCKEGVKLAINLADKSDIVIENFSPKIRKKWDLSYRSFKKNNPSLILLSISAFGRTGPEKNFVGYGRNLHAAAGLTSLIGYHYSKPRGQPGQWADALTALTGTYAVLSCLWKRKKSNQGQHIDLSMVEATAVQLCEPILDFQMNNKIRGGAANRSHYAVPHNCYPCKGYDKWVTIAISTENQWKELCNVMKNPKWIQEKKFSNPLQRYENQKELDELLGKWTLNYSAYDMMHKLQKKGIEAGIVMDIKTLSEDPHLKARKFFKEIDHPEIGKRKIADLPWRLKNNKQCTNRHAPMIGEHNDYVFNEIIGLSKKEISQLKKKKIIF